MASSRPVRIWVMRQTANREPKFHQAEMLDGAGRSIRELLIIFHETMYGKIDFI